MNPNLFQEALISAMYRLLFLSAPKSDGKPKQTAYVKALHLAMTAFSATVLLQAQGTEARFEELSLQLREAIYSLNVDTQAPNEAHVWILVIAGISAITSEDDHWLLPLLRQMLPSVEVSTWAEMRVLLKKFLWIDTIHDKGGRNLFNQVTRHGSILSPEKRDKTLS